MSMSSKPNLGTVLTLVVSLTYREMVVSLEGMLQAPAPHTHLVKVLQQVHDPALHFLLL